MKILIFANENNLKLNYTIMAQNTLNKQKLVGLLEKIDQKQKELKKLRADYKKAFNTIALSWKEEVSTLFPQLKPCNIDEYVGVDVPLNGKVYNIFISEGSGKLECMFSLDRKDKKNYPLIIKDVMKEADFEKLKRVFNSYLDQHIEYVYSNHQAYYIKFKKVQYEEACQFFLEIVRTFA